MSSNITYTTLLQVIELFASEHLQIKRFHSDFPDNIPDFSNQLESFPILFVSPNNSVFQSNTNVFNIRVYCFDLIQEGRENINTILSDTNSILSDLRVYLTEGDVIGIDVLNNPSVTPLNNQLLDYAAGWYMDIQIEVNTAEICAIPFANTPIISGELCNSVTYQSSVPSTRVLTINGVSQDLSADREWIVGGGGSTIFFDWRFDNSTTSSDPGSGDFRFNSTIASGITNIYIDSINNNGDDMDYYFTKLEPNLWNIYIQQKTDDTRRGQFELTGTPINNSGWWTLPVKYVTSTGNGAPNNNTICNIAFQKTGENIEKYVTGGTFSDIHNVKFTNNVDETFDINGFVSTGQTATVNGLTKNFYDANREWIVAEVCTGVLNFGGLSAGTATTIKIPPITGVIVDNESVPGYSNPQIVSYSGNSAVTVTTLSSTTQTYVLLNSNGEIYFQNTFPTSAERKQNIWLGKIGHPMGSITVVLNEPDYVISPNSKINDLFQAIIYINDGVYPYANGNNLTFNITNGNIHGNGINYHNDRTMPNEVQMGPYSPTPFLYRVQTGGTFGATFNIDPTSYDLNGVVTPVGGGINASTNQYIFCIPSVGFIVQYGQTKYNSFTDAIENIGKENFVIYENLINNAILIGVLTVKRTATNLSDTTQAQFFRANKLGEVIGAVGGTSTGTLQTAYNNSVQPQIVTNPSQGALQIKGYDGGTNNIFQILNSASSVTVNITENGNITASTFVKSGGTSSQFLKADGSVDTTIYQALLTNPITGSGTTNIIPKFSSSSAITNSNLSDNGTLLSSTTDMVINGLTVGLGGGNVSSNTAVGFNALSSNITGGDNVAIGRNALLNNKSNFNTAIGRSSLSANINGSQNTSVGYSSLILATGSSQNTAIGYASLLNLLTGDLNTTIGRDSGRYIADGSTSLSATTQSIYIGGSTKALSNGSTNEIVIGYNTIGNGSNSVTLGNTSITKTVLQGTVNVKNYSGNTTSILTFINSGGSIVNEFRNNSDSIGIGVDSLKNNTASQTTSVGYQSLMSNTSGAQNTAYGYNSLSQNLVGNQNSAFGGSSLTNNLGNENSAFGYTCFLNLNGNQNSGFGSRAGRFIADGVTSLTSSTQSTFVGAYTKASANGNTNEIVIGYNAIGNGSNSVTLGNTSITNTYLQGNVRGNAFIKSGGTSNQYLMADGSVSTNGTVTASRFDITGTNYTILSSDNIYRLFTTSSSATTLNITTGLTSNQQYQINQWGGGQITFSAGTGVTLRYKDYETNLSYGQYSRIFLEWVGTNEYLLYGDLKTI